ncbi:MAG: thioredoxin family protein [Planctomycetota bacterium]
MAKRTGSRMGMAAGLLALPIVGVGLGVIGTTGVAGAAETELRAAAAMPKLVVAKFHADWCGKCRAMAEPLDAARRALIEEPVLFVTYDFTDESTSRQAEYLASVLGQSDVWDEYGRRTGFALLINPETGEVVSRLGTPDADAIESAVRGAL